MSLLSAIVILEAQEALTLPGNLGRATHAWFLDQVGRVDAEAAARLHEPNQERPFTVSNVWEPGMPTRDVWSGRARWEIPAGGQVYVRITTYSAPLTRLVEENIFPALDGHVQLGEAFFSFVRVLTRPEEGDASLKPWLGRMTFEELIAAHTLQRSPAARVTLRFVSPTVFRSRGHFMPFPLPRLVFESLVRRWNAFAPVRVHEDVVRYADEAMAISSYNLRTEHVRFGEEGERGAMSGFVGRCTYAMRVKDRYWMGVVQALAHFAFYAGVGKRTSMGLGQVRKVDFGVMRNA